MLSSKHQKDKYLFDINNYKFIKEIKKGGFGVVNLVENKNDKSKYAAKTNLIQNTRQSKLCISREVNILIEIQHPTTVQFRGFSYVDFDNKKNITILMDYMTNGSLADLILKEEKGQCPHEFDNTKRQIILIGIARGMMLLHKLHIIHRDLKLDNILLDDNFYPHISDFGLSKIFDPNHSMSQSFSNIGTAAYMAPEVINGNSFNTKADVYSFGILMYEVLTGKRAYKNLLYGKKSITIFQFHKKVCDEHLRPEIEKGMMKKGHQIMIEKCLSEDPKERPTFSELYKKLSLSTDDFLDFASQIEPNVIDYEEGEDDGNDDEDEIGLNTKFCLDSVDYDEVFDYIEMIKVEPKSHIVNEEVEQMKMKIKELEEKNSLQSLQIQELTTKLSHQIESNTQKHIFKPQLNEQFDNISQNIVDKMLVDINEIKRQIENLGNKVDTLNQYAHTEIMKIYEMLSPNLDKRIKKMAEQSINDLSLNEIIAIKQKLDSLKQQVSDFQNVQQVQNESIKFIDFDIKRIKEDIRCVKYEVKLIKLRNQES